MRAANVKDGVLDLTDVKSMNFTPQEQAIFSLRPGDVLVTEGSGSLTAVGASAVWQGEVDGTVCFQNTLLRLRPRAGTDPRFLAWWARSAFGSGVFASVATGANIYHVSAQRVRALPCDLPPLDEQRRIADYLDKVTVRIEALASLRGRQIELLAERYLSRIRDAVKGAREPGGRRESGLEWLGSVPDNWPLCSIASQYDVQLGKMLNQERVKGRRLRPYLRVLNVQWDHIDVDELVEMDFPVHERSRFEVLPGDLLICEGGSYPGRAAIWNGCMPEIYYQKALHRARSRGRSLNRWLYYCLRLAREMGVFEVQGNSTTMTHLTGEQLAVQRFPFPNPVTQSRIVGQLDEVSKAESDLRLGWERNLNLLEEQRRALITAAVTGQFDVSTAGAGRYG
ncbi:hypothetical protein [Actinomadura bangladeshensis]|uniref:Restriction endonuclease subunit S n=1 Tax=Actinomadura bangladeshensis TaxID=453573 RepID=A0A6L9QQG0_9ACTN|nr:hypothetical protein [Actinomadura bangladeshensis]NEA27336.1 hypothetical protein [Actinomadura bangladeshensis]